MPKPVTISKEMIDETAFALVKEGGIEALSVRNIARALGCSTKPIYRTYGSMEELRKGTHQKIALYMKDMVYNYRETGRPLLDFGISYIFCAAREKHFFLYLCQTTIHSKLSFTGVLNDKMIKLYASETGISGLPPEKLGQIAGHCGFFVFSLAVSCSYGIFNPTEDEIRTILQDFLDIQIRGI